MNSMEGLIGHEQIVHFFASALAKGNCTHAYLFSGPLSVGKTTLITALAQRMLCKTGSGNDACVSCAAHAKGHHPDFSFFDPDVFFDPKTEEHPETIKIDYLRDIERWASLKPVMSSVKIQAIVHAGRLTIEAANALLKLLEDPPPAMVLFLSAESGARLPATLRSRMQHFRLSRVPYESIVSLLSVRGTAKKQCEEYAAFAHGCPGVAIRCMEDDGVRENYVRTIDQWLKLLQNPMHVFQLIEREGEKMDFRSFFMTGQILLHDILRLHWGMSQRFRSLVSNDDRQAFVKRYSQKKLHAMSRSLLDTLRLLRTNASSKLIVENFFVSI